MAVIDLHRSSVTVPRQGTRTGVVTVATIVDARHECAFGDDVRLLPLDVRSAAQQLEEARPQLLVVASSVGRGAWRRRLVRGRRPHPHLEGLLAHARSLGITTVFWNVDDPSGYDTAIATARLADHVLTVNAQRVPWYRVDLEHNRIGVLPADASAADVWERLARG